MTNISGTVKVYSAGIVEKTVESSTGFHDIRCYMRIIHSVKYFILHIFNYTDENKNVNHYLKDQILGLKRDMME